jgi:hypothetical protein
MCKDIKRKPVAYMKVLFENSPRDTEGSDGEPRSQSVVYCDLDFQCHFLIAYIIKISFYPISKDRNKLLNISRLLKIL